MKVTFGQQTTKVKQLADLLSQEISMGKYKSDCTLPSINKLSREYQVSRDTVFKAFIDLNYTQEQMAEILEISSAYYGKVERGIHGLSLKKLMHQQWNLN